jgi:UDP-N-acetyl-D-mannosaminuronate dehydrogenase
VWITEETVLAQGLSDFFCLSLKSTKKGLCAALQRSGFAYGHCHNVEDVLRIIFASRLVTSGYLCPTDDFSQLRKCDAAIVCVPTPLGEWRNPDLTFVINTAKTIAEHLQPGQLVVLESTTFPGTTEEVLLPILEAGEF